MASGWLAALAMLALSACSTLAPRPTGAVIEGSAATRALQKLERFELKGRVAGAVGSEGFNAQLDWRQRDADSRLSLRSPLGFGSATVETDGSTLRFESSRGERAEGDAAMQALQSRLGFEPPLASLRYWLRGVPDPSGPAVEEVATAGEGSRFSQFGWQVSVTERQPLNLPEGTVLAPKRVTVERPPVRLRVIVEAWTLP